MALPHVAVTFTNSLQVCFAAALDEIGTELNVVGASSEFLSVLATIAAAPVIATIPTRMARQYGPRFGLTLSPVPLELRLPAVSMIWPLQLDRDAASVWLRTLVADILRTTERAACRLAAAG